MPPRQSRGHQQSCDRATAQRGRAQALPGVANRGRAAPALQSQGHTPQRVLCESPTSVSLPSADALRLKPASWSACWEGTHASKLQDKAAQQTPPPPLPGPKLRPYAALSQAAADDVASCALHSVTRCEGLAGASPCRLLQALCVLPLGDKA